MQIMRTIIRIEDSYFNEMQQYREEYVNAEYDTMCDAYYNFSKSFNISVQNSIWYICESLYVHCNSYFGKMSFYNAYTFSF